MSDLAKNNNGSGTNGANGDGINGKTGVGDKIDAAALYRLGRALAFGLDGVKIDGPRGLALLEAAAEAGSLDAQGELAEALFDGLQGTQPDAARAVEIAKKPAQAGNPFALDGGKNGVWAATSARGTAFGVAVLRFLRVVGAFFRKLFFFELRRKMVANGRAVGYNKTQRRAFGDERGSF